MKKSDFFLSESWQKRLLWLALFIAILSFFTDFLNVSKYGCIDLRNRVVGARLCERGNANPYTYKWSAGEPEIYCDPCDNPELAVNRVTATPAVLLIHKLFANWHYSIQKYFWFIFQWGLLLAIGFLTSQTIEANKKVVWIVTLLFSSSSIWRMNIEKGQIYVLYAFLMSLALYLLKKEKSGIWCGFVVGLLAVLRPNTAVLILPFLIWKKWKVFIGWMFGFAVSFFSTLIPHGLELWKNYLKAMEIQQRIYLMNKLTTIETDVYKVIEGMNNINSALVISQSDSSLQGLLRKFFGWDFSGLTLLSAYLTILLVLIVILLRKRDKQTSVNAFFVGLSWVILSEFFLPTRRNLYNNIIFLVPLLMILQNYLKLFWHSKGNVILVIGLLFTFMFQTLFLVEIMATYLLAFFFIYFAFRVATLATPEYYENK
jgi:hypothetical protein